MAYLAFDESWNTFKAQLSHGNGNKSYNVAKENDGYHISFDSTSTEGNLSWDSVLLEFDKDNEHLIYDWRSPVGNLFYDGAVGRASYIAPDGVIEGILTKKRQYKSNIFK